MIGGIDPFSTPSRSPKDSRDRRDQGIDGWMEGDLRMEGDVRMED